MCGIHVIIDKTKTLDKGPIEKMGQASTHRGEEALGYFHQEQAHYQIFMAHNRLKIIDLSEQANQPLVTEDSREALVYNGEIYNYKEISKKYFGEESLTSSDTITLWKYLREKQKVGLEELKGMYAFVYWNGKKNQLLVARDDFGVKPLCYYQDEQYLIISSEIRSLLASSLIVPTLNESVISYYLQYRFAKAPHSFYNGIFEFPTDTVTIDLPYFTHKKEGSKRILRKNQPSGKTLTGEAEKLIKESLTLQMQADVPIGLSLSGGVDSTLLLALLQEMGYKDLPAYTITYSSQDNHYATRDAVFAQKAALQYGASWRPVQVGEEVLTNFEDFVAQLNQPVADGAALLMKKLAGYARQEVKVLLSGAGADELFAGYNRHTAFYWYLKLALNGKYKNLIIRNLAHLSTSYPQVIHISRKWRKLLQDNEVFPSRTFLNYASLSLPVKKANDADNELVRVEKDWMQEALEWDRKNYLTQDVLRLTDEMSMQENLEVRVPYLYQPLTTWVRQLSSKQLFKSGNKWILKELLSAKGGSAYVKRRKAGFGMPFGHWIRKDRWRHLVAPLKDRQHLVYQFLDFAQTQHLLEKHLARQADYTSEIWALLVLVYWLNVHFPTH